jgi:hypothetical protein
MQLEETNIITEALQTQNGDRDGQQLFIRENDNSVTAHLWSSSRGQWDLVRIAHSPIFILMYSY